MGTGDDPPGTEFPRKYEHGGRRLGHPHNRLAKTLIFSILTASASKIGPEPG